jgi:DeoR/GlpR family transcriptional regulator of sugar metabolism
MFAAQRIEIIKDMMKKHKSINISMLTEVLNVSDVTVRKDLEKLQEEGFLKKTFGGAILIEESSHDAPKQDSIEHSSAKELISQLAATQIQKGDTIFLGSGSTCYLLSQKLKEMKDITVVTNNVNALNELVPHIQRVFFVGGEIVYQDRMISTSSERVDEYFKGIYVDKAFTSVTGIDLMAGLTVNHAISSYIFKKIQEISATWTLLVDEHKFGKRGLYQVATIDSPDCIITNKIDQEFLTPLQQHDVKVITCS